MKLTKPQYDALRAAFFKNGAVYGRGLRSFAGGAYHRLCRRLATQTLVTEDAPFPITVRGMVVLHDHMKALATRDSSMALQEDMEKLQAAMAEMPGLVAAARQRLGSAA